MIFQFPISLEPSSQLPIHQVTIDPWFQISTELEDEGKIYNDCLDCPLDGDIFLVMNHDLFFAVLEVSTPEK